MEYKEYKISQVYQALYDGPHATPPVVDEGAVFLGISNITEDGRLDFSDIKYISEEDLSKWTKRVTPQEGDIVFSYEATLNRYAIIPEDFWGCLGRRIALIRPDNKKALGKYLYYYFFSKQWRSLIANKTISGATVDRIPLIKFPQFKVYLPDLTVQRRIVDVLDCYYEFIENNTKRIKLLEQMAENLYKEWFVRFRFPGHEDVEYDESNPRGWIFGDREITNKPKDWHFGVLKELGEFVRGKNITADKMVEGDIAVISAGLSPSGYHNEANVFGNSLTISASGANAGYLLYHLDDIWAADCSYYQSDENLWFVYNTLKFLQPVISNMQAGAAQPHVYPKHVNRISMIIPDENWIRKYCEIVSPVYDEIRVLKDKNQNLIKQRDLLLPRLMSGKLEVK